MIEVFQRVGFRLEKAEDVYGPQTTEPAGMHRSVLFSDDEEDSDTAEPPKLSEAALRRKERRERQRLKAEEAHSAARK